MICDLGVWRGDGSLGKALTYRFKDSSSILIPRTYTKFLVELALVISALESWRWGEGDSVPGPSFPASMAYLIISSQ